MSTQQTYRKKIITEHHPFWDIIDKIELPIVKFLQTLLFASKFHKFWVYAAWISSSTSLSYYPSILFSLGLADKAKQLSTSLVFMPFSHLLASFSLNADVQEAIQIPTVMIVLLHHHSISSYNWCHCFCQFYSHQMAFYHLYDV